jgi:protein phosphatase PTC7
MKIFRKHMLVSIRNQLAPNINKFSFKRFGEVDMPKTPNQFKTKIKYRFNSGFVKIPHFSKKEKGGEDAYAIHEGMVCVADGVGGWNEMGVDPSKYSNELCANILQEYLKNGNLFYSTPKKLFINACNNTQAKGSATFCMGVLDLEKEYLHTVNMGDSGYMLIRGKNQQIQNPNPSLEKIINKNQIDTSATPFNIIFRSEEQQHSFNFPFQVGTHGDDPSNATTQVHQFQENDIIILATDGLWDNLYENQILQVIKPFYDVSERLRDPTIVAELIGETCEKLSLDTKYKSPFCKRSRGLYLGGKPDDITIIVSQIIKNED